MKLGTILSILVTYMFLVLMIKLTLAFFHLQTISWGLACSATGIAGAVGEEAAVAAESSEQKVKSNVKIHIVNYVSDHEFFLNQQLLFCSKIKSHTFGAFVFALPVCKGVAFFDANTRDPTVS